MESTVGKFAGTRREWRNVSTLGVLEKYDCRLGELVVSNMASRRQYFSWEFPWRSGNTMSSDLDYLNQFCGIIDDAGFTSHVRDDKSK